MKEALNDADAVKSIFISLLMPVRELSVHQHEEQGKQNKTKQVKRTVT